MRVHWTDRARVRLQAIENHIAEDNLAAARETVEKLLRRSQRLAEPPEIGHRLRGFEQTALREVLIRPYRLIYRRHEAHIDVITVLHYRQLLPSDLSNLTI